MSAQVRVLAHNCSRRPGVTQSSAPLTIAVPPRFAVPDFDATRRLPLLSPVFANTLVGSENTCWTRFPARLHAAQHRGL